MRNGRKKAQKAQKREFVFRRLFLSLLPFDELRALSLPKRRLFAPRRARGLELVETAAKSFLSQRGGGSNFRARNVQFSRSWRVLFNESSGADHAAGFLVGNHDCRRGRIQSARGKRVLRGKALPKIPKVRQKIERKGLNT